MKVKQWEVDFVISRGNNLNSISSYTIIVFIIGVGVGIGSALEEKFCLKF
jgi:hypothetical protein